MKRVICLLFIVAFTGAMLLPIASHVNLHSGNRVQLADNGGPTPPWPPSRSVNGYVTSLSA
jgi:hypothetical protein